MILNSERSLAKSVNFNSSSLSLSLVNCIHPKTLYIKDEVGFEPTAKQPSKKLY